MHNRYIRSDVFERNQALNILFTLYRLAKLRCSVNWKCCTFLCTTVLHHALIIRTIGQHILCTHMFPWCLSKSLPHHRHTWAISELSAVPQAFVRPISVCFSPPRPPLLPVYPVWLLVLPLSQFAWRLSLLLFHFILFCQLATNEAALCIPKAQPRPAY